MPRRCTAGEDLDDGHATATAWASWLAGIDSGSGRLVAGVWSGEQLTRACDVVGASAFSEQAVVSDAVEATRQHMDEEAADELVSPGKRTAASRRSD